MSSSSSPRLYWLLSLPSLMSESCQICNPWLWIYWLFAFGFGHWSLFCPYKCCGQLIHACSVPFLLPLSLFIARLGTLITSESLLRSFVGDQMMRRTGPDGYFVSFLSSSSGESLPLVPHLCSCAMLARAKTPVKTVAHFNLMLITFSTLFIIRHMCFYRIQSTTNINKHSRQNS